jgi:CPA2 family monovalent cation:H+ antiporter-2
MGLLLLDTVLLLALVIGTALTVGKVALFVEARLGIGRVLAERLVIVGAVVLAVPFLVGVAGISRRLAATLAAVALPHRTDGRVDLAAAPRRVLVVTLQVVIVLLIGTPLVAITQPFLRGFTGPLLVLLLLVALGVALWRGATNLQGHVRAGAQVIVDALAAQSHSKGPSAAAHGLEPVHGLLPGLGEPEPFRLEATSPAVGKTLAELNLRGLTGATVLAIQRGEEGVSFPTAQEVLRPGDVLALAGTHDAVEAAKGLLVATPQRPAAPEVPA